MRLVALIVILSLCLIGIMVKSIDYMNSGRCEVQARSFEHEYSFVGGCMIQYEGVWLPIENLRIRNLAAHTK